MNLTHIQYFLTAAKYLNFTEASKNLYIAQPTLSNTIANLEKEVGFKLFVRNRKSVKLTAGGTVLYNEFSNIIDNINNSIEKAREANIGTDGKIRIGCLEAINTSFLFQKIVTKFMESYPKIELAFERYSFRILREKLLNDELDVIFTFSFEINSIPDIKWMSIYSSKAVIAVPLSNPLSIKDSITFAELKEETISVISPDESPGGAKGVLEICKRHGFRKGNIKYCPNLESLLLYLESGFGVALVDESIKINDFSNIKFLALEEEKVDIVMVWKEENPLLNLPLFIDLVLDMPINTFNLKNKK